MLSVGTAVRSVGGSALESGPTSDGDDDLGPAGPGPLRRAFSRPGTWLGLLLLALALFADRHLFGRGSLQGGALLAAPAKSSDLWSRYLESWHDVSVGSSTTAPPSLAVLSLPSWLAFGHVGIIVTILLLGAVPLAGISAYVLAGRLTRHRGVRVWAAATYALLPALTGAVAAGRLGTAILGWLLPLIVLLVLRAVRLGSRWTATWLAVLLLAAAEAFVPLMWLATAILAIAVLAVGAARRGITSLWRGAPRPRDSSRWSSRPRCSCCPGRGGWRSTRRGSGSRPVLPRQGPSTPSCPPGRWPSRSRAARSPVHAGSSSAR